jgi:hypothetical protein
MTGTDVRVEPAREGPALRDFIRLPSRIYRDDPAWVPQLAFERKQYFSERNPVYREKQVALWTAYRDGRPVGRISAQASAKSPVVGHFGCLECEDDPATVDALFRTAEQWLASRGATQIAGPFSLSINDECGLLVEGFDDPPMAMMPHGRRYYDTHMRRQGLAKSADMLAYLFDLRQPFTPLAENMVKRAFRNPRISLRSIRPKDIGKNVISIMEIFNDGWRNNWGFEPMSPETARFIAEQMRHVLMDGMVWMADYDGQPAAIAVTMPNVNQALSPLRHSPAPIGILKTANILLRKKFTTARIPLMGVRKEFQGSVSGAELVLAATGAARDAVLALGIESVEMSWVLEENAPTRHIIEQLVGGEMYKRYRIYSKPIGPVDGQAGAP